MFNHAPPHPIPSTHSPARETPFCFLFPYFQSILRHKGEALCAMLGGGGSAWLSSALESGSFLSSLSFLFNTLRHVSLHAEHHSIAGPPARKTRLCSIVLWRSSFTLPSENQSNLHMSVSWKGPRKCKRGRCKDAALGKEVKIKGKKGVCR